MNTSLLKIRIANVRVAKRISFFSALALALAVLFSCVTPPQKEECSRELLGSPMKNSEQLTAFFMNHKSDFEDKDKVARIAALYVTEGAIEVLNKLFEKK